MLHQVLYLSIIYGSNRRLTLRPLPVPESAPLHPEQSVGSGKSRLKILPFQNVE